MKYTYDSLEPIIKSSTSFAEVCRKLGLKPNGGSSSYIKQVAAKLQIDISHFTGKGWTKDLNKKCLVYRIPAQDVLVKRDSCSGRDKSHRLTRALLEIGRDYQCALCGLQSMWQNAPISLHVDHIDGDALNNVIDNLRFLCPNCHSQTPNYCRPKAQKDIKRFSTNHVTAQRWSDMSPKMIDTLPPNNTKKDIVWDQCDCGKPKRESSKICLSCVCKARKPSLRAKKIDWPDSDTLKQMLASSSCLAVARTLGVSDNAIRKHLKKHGEVA